MEKTEQVIQNFAQFSKWVQSLMKVEDNLLFEPIKKGKWSSAEIISHIIYWDRYMLQDVIPKMTSGANIESVRFEVINQPASEYALSGVTKEQLIREQTEARSQLILALKEKSEEEFFATFSLNGEKIDQYSGYPHSLFNYISAFVWHDNHHKEQIEAFLGKSSEKG
ncbi:DinB superfamily protein [Gracilibacillus orientalis]|uniref:DinB superfamily protein n=1 Tax=Gracilibacillus orientalis TaxID=334253 RepID=A0A1I4IXU8_9BACI|nr:DinB family protein [Gracilibacillus orientalis]SFL59145.1 DinB superfamily protein [Gracilibacillus orientalis]